jgi:hypothetical protein
VADRSCTFVFFFKPSAEQTPHEFGSADPGVATPDS